MCYIQEPHIQCKDSDSIKVNTWGKVYHANTNPKKDAVGVLILDKADMRSRKLSRGKEGHYTISKGSILQEDVTILNMLAPNRTASKYIRQTLTEFQEKIHKSQL